MDSRKPWPLESLGKMVSISGYLEMSRSLKSTHSSQVFSRVYGFSSAQRPSILRLTLETWTAIVRGRVSAGLQ